jgi:vanillate O-demethylase monooxygenase subunit
MLDLPEDGYSELFLKPDKALRRARHIFVSMLRDEGPAGEERAAGTARATG